jgi:hypothetical protein
LDEKANLFKVRYLYGKPVRICGGHKREGEGALPGEVCNFAIELPSLRGGGKKMQKSAEGIVVPFDRSEGPNVK